MAITRSMAKNTQVVRGRARPRSLSFIGASAIEDVAKTIKVSKKPVAKKTAAQHTPRKRAVAAVRQSLDENAFRPIQSTQQQRPMESNITLRLSRSGWPLYSDIHGVQVRVLARGIDTEPVIMPVPTLFCDYISHDISFGQDTIRIMINRVRRSTARSPVRRHSTGSRLLHQDNDQMNRSPCTSAPRLLHQDNDQLRRSQRTPVPRSLLQDNDQRRRSPRTPVPRRKFRTTAYHA